MATPLMRCIRRHFPSAEILLLVRSTVQAVVERLPWFDRVVSYRRRGPAGMSEFWRCVALLRRWGPDLGFILPGSFRTALMFFLGGVNVRVGYVRSARKILLSEPLVRPRRDGSFRPTYMADYYLSLCRSVGLNHCENRTELHFARADMRRTRAALSRAGVDTSRPLFLLHPGAAYGPSKRWPERNWARLAELMEDRWPGELCVVGGAEERETCRRIARFSGARITNLQGAGIDLHLLKCLVSLSDLMVTTDSGPRHYGVACGIPTVCIMGPTHPDYSTSGRPHDIVVRCETGCGPCQQRVCTGDHRCMNAISPRMAISYCVEALLQHQERP